jgi:heavy metal translocating P-type ATPase
LTELSTSAAKDDQLRSIGGGRCRLCGLPVGRSEARLEEDGQVHGFCCAGCLYVYQILSNRPEGPPSDFLDTDLYSAAVQAGVVAGPAGGRAGPGEKPAFPEEILQETYFKIEGMWCTACAFLVEEVLRKQEGIVEAEVLFSSDLARIRFLPHRVGVQEAMDEVSKLGYKPLLFEEDTARSAEKRDMLVRLGVSSILTMNIMGLSLVVYVGLFQDLGQETVVYLSYPLWIMCTAVLSYGGRPIFGGAAVALRHRTGSMDTLIATGSLAAYLYSVYRMSQGSIHLYFDTAAMLITLVLLGRYVEGHARDRVTRGIHEIYRLARQKVRLLVNEREKWSLPEAVRKGDLFEVRKGERAAVDGRMRSERTTVDESFLTGESRPIRRSRGEAVTAGSLILGEDARLEAISEGGASTLSEMVKLLQESLALKNPTELLADRITRTAVPALLLLAGSTALCLPALGISWSDALLRAIAVLVITCPCALGIATPLARVASLGAARREGILIGDPDALEKARWLDAVVLDKTGTVTEGRFDLRCTVMEEGTTLEEGLVKAAAVESHSDHFIAREILRKAGMLSIEFGPCSRFESFEGMGVGGVVHDVEVLVGNPSLMRSRGWSIPSSMEEKAGELERSGQTVVFMAWAGAARGLLSFGDAAREDAFGTVARLQARGMEVWLASGDSAETTAAFARTLKVDRHVGRALPPDKVEIVKSLQRRGKRVGMVGDGINDAAALAQADVGFALGAGDNILQKAGGVTILARDLQRVIDTIDLSAFTMRVVRQNLFFSFLYNGLGIPMAIAGFLNPVLAAAAMFASSLTVIGNTIRITRRRVGRKR